jgi:SAM-dependent methyltransferase
MEYSGFAKYYDLFYQKKDYKKETEFLLNFIRPYSKVLDLGCGTGIHGQILEQNNCYVDGLDASHDMLQISKDRIHGELFCQNMLDLNIKKRYDVIISMFAVLNHLKNNDELIKVFKNLSNILSSNGKLIIDLHNPQTSGEKTDEYQNVKRKMKWEYDKHNHIENSIISFEINNKTYIDNHQFRIFEIKDIKNCCKVAGLKTINTFENYNINEKGTKTSKNIQFLIVQENYKFPSRKTIDKIL